MSRSARPARAALRLSAAALAALALSGCGTTVRSGAAALVGSARITTDQLATDVDSGLKDPGAEQLAADRPAFQRDVLGRLINARIVQEAARRHGIAVSPGDIDTQYSAIEQSVGGPEQLRTQAAAAGLSLAQVRELARSRALTTALGDQLVQGTEPTPQQYAAAYRQAADSLDLVHTAQIQQPTLAAARALLPQARGLSDAAFAELAKTRSTDAATKPNGGDLGFTPRSAFAQGGLEAYGAAAFKARVGDTFAVASPRGGHVVRVLGRRTTTLEQARPQLKRTILADRIGPAVEAELRTIADELHIKVNPRFGSWDPAQLQVVAAPAPSDGAVSPSTPAGGAPDGAAPGGAAPDGTAPDGTGAPQ